MTQNAGYIGDHEDRAVKVLTGNRAKKPETQQLTRALTRSVQSLEDNISDVRSALTLAGATGVWLDRLGRIVGEPRGGLSDAEYRRFISARLQINRSQGERERLIRIAQLMSGASFVQMTSAYPAGYTMLIVTPTFLSESIRTRIRQRMEQATSAGVGVDLSNGVSSKDTVFRLDNSAMPDAGDPGDGMAGAF